HLPNENIKAELHWKRAFTEGDSNYQSQFWYARQLFINKKNKDSHKFFKKLKSVPVDPKIKHEIRGILIDDKDKPIIFSGQVIAIEASYIRIKVSSESFNVYCHKNKIEDNLWNKIHLNSKLDFTLGFNYHGLSVSELINVSE
ncbi:MAG: hypothetical protein KIT59_12175, partial [Nitrosomonas sp.]|nr:hypothetical protein [Nitrosomonas sp.]